MACQLEDVLERVQQRLDKDPAQLALRSMTVEHPYGTIKSSMGAMQFKMRRLKHVATEMALHVIAYEMTRVMTIIGIPALIAAISALKAAACPNNSVSAPPFSPYVKHQSAKPATKANSR